MWHTLADAKAAKGWENTIELFLDSFCAENDDVMIYFKKKFICKNKKRDCTSIIHNSIICCVGGVGESDFCENFLTVTGNGQNPNHVFLALETKRMDGISVLSTLLSSYFQSIFTTKLSISQDKKVVPLSEKRVPYLKI